MNQATPFPLAAGRRRLGAYPPARFRYGIAPTSVPFTDDPQRPSVVTLMLTVHNPEERQVACSRIVFDISEGVGASDLIADGKAVLVRARPAAGTSWSIVGDGAGGFTAEPAGGNSGLGPGESIAFDFSHVQVNSSGGPAPIIAWEDTDLLRVGHIVPDLVKITPRLAITKFTIEPIQVAPGDTVRMVWESYGASSATLSWSGTSHPVEVNGSDDDEPRRDTVYTLTVMGQGMRVTAQLTVVVARVKILDFQPDTSIVPQGGPTSLRWLIVNASQAQLDEEAVDPGSGSKIVTPSQTTRYQLTAVGLGGQDNASASVVVKPVEIVAFKADPSHAGPTRKARLIWELAWSIGARIEPGVGEVPSAGSREVEPANDTVYTLVAQGYKGPLNAVASVTVERVEITRFTVEPVSIAPGENATIRWTSERATSLTLEPGIGQVETSGERAVAPEEPITYVLTAQGPNGPVDKRVTLDVRSVRFTYVGGLRTPEDKHCYLVWRTLYCTSVDIRPVGGVWITGLPADGRHDWYSLSGNETWELRAHGAGKSPVHRQYWVGDG